MLTLFLIDFLQQMYVNLRQYDGRLYANVHAGDGTE